MGPNRLTGFRPSIHPTSVQINPRKATYDDLHSPGRAPPGAPVMGSRLSLLVHSRNLSLWPPRQQHLPPGVRPPVVPLRRRAGPSPKGGVSAHSV